MGWKEFDQSGGRLLDYEDKDDGSISVTLGHLLILKS